MLRHLLLVFVLVNWPSANCENKTETCDINELLLKLQENFGTMEERVTKLEEEVEELKRENIRLKTKDARSCAELQAKGFNQSGTYEIDPDSTGRTIQVQCDMGTGATEIGHQAEHTVEIGYCSGDGCFNQEYNYTAPMNQIEALMSMSDTCEQEIKYDCNIAPLKADLQGFNYGWWVDRHEQKKFYFDGSNEDVHVCGCYPNCTQSMFNATCNCDASLVPFWNSDSGKITNKRSLPIKAFFYGGFISNQQKAKITVGRLRCNGVALGFKSKKENSQTNQLQNVSVQEATYTEPIKGCIGGYNDATITKITLEECKQRCSTSSSFLCKSLEYDEFNDNGLKECRLSRETRRTQSESFVQPCHAGDDIYLERKDLLKPCQANGFKCKSDGHCIVKSWVCDGDTDCADGTDEEGCEADLKLTEFHCVSGKSVPIGWKCDGEVDCFDGSDEINC